MKELLKSVHICQSYRKNKSGTFFMAQYGVLGSSSTYMRKAKNQQNKDAVLIIISAAGTFAYSLCRLCTDLVKFSVSALLMKKSCLK